MRQMKTNRFTPIDCRFTAKMLQTACCESLILISCLAVLLLGILPAGCANVSPRGRTQQRVLYEQELSAPYDQTVIKKSLTLDVLPKIQRTQQELESRFAENELFTHSESVVASSGQSKNSHKTWFNMVAFHEYQLNAVRKYFFMVDDTAGTLRPGSRRGLRFDCEMVLEEDILNKPDVSENARQIAMLTYVLDGVHRDMDELGANVDAPGQSNKMLSVCGMLINQTVKTILLKLESAPALAARLSEVDGIEFDHINFGKGTARMVVVGDVVMVKVRVGAFVRATEYSQ